jgi:putative acetyltransferase
MVFLLETARMRGVSGLHSHVSLTAQPLFLRHGFRIDARQTVHLRGVAFENARMSLMFPHQPAHPGTVAGGQTP